MGQDILFPFSTHKASCIYPNEPDNIQAQQSMKRSSGTVIFRFQPHFRRAIMWLYVCPSLSCPLMITAHQIWNIQRTGRLVGSGHGSAAETWRVCHWVESKSDFLKLRVHFRLRFKIFFSVCACTYECCVSVTHSGINLFLFFNSCSISEKPHMLGRLSSCPLHQWQIDT